MQGVFGFSVLFLFLASSCSCSRQLMAPWLITDYHDLDYENDFDYDYGNGYGEILASGAKPTSLDVTNYGAAGDGQKDDSEAFRTAWKVVCGESTTATATLVVPQGKTFLLNKPVLFDGPCNATSIHFQLKGTLVAPRSTSWPANSSYLILFKGVNNLILDGGGIGKIDGQGFYWWWKSCPMQKINSFTNSISRLSCQQPHRPGTLQFQACNNLQLSGLTHLNSPRAHIAINGCNGVKISGLNINAPENSPNTDGIDISASSNITIQDSKIGTGDDCVAINGNSSSINITGVQCGPGHGISIGSLGDGPYDTVEEVHVSNCQLKGTQNGVRIKTFKGKRGYARKISFEHITFEDVRNPIIIDQHYIDKSKNQKTETEEAIKVSDITYSDLHGTSANDKAIDLDCDDFVACTNIVMQNINITPGPGVGGKPVGGFCNNARGTAAFTEPKMTCLV